MSLGVRRFCYQCFFTFRDIIVVIFELSTHATPHDLSRKVSKLDLVAVDVERILRALAEASMPASCNHLTLLFLAKILHTKTGYDFGISA